MFPICPGSNMLHHKVGGNVAKRQGLEYLGTQLLIVTEGQEVEGDQAHVNYVFC